MTELEHIDLALHGAAVRSHGAARRALEQLRAAYFAGLWREAHLAYQAVAA